MWPRDECATASDNGSVFCLSCPDMDLLPLRLFLYQLLWKVWGGCFQSGCLFGGVSTPRMPILMMTFKNLLPSGVTCHHFCGKLLAGNSCSECSDSWRVTTHESSYSCANMGRTVNILHLLRTSVRCVALVCGWGRWYWGWFLFVMF